MRKLMKFMTAALVLTFTFSFPAMAGQWQSDALGWWWQDDDGTYPRNTWRWLDGNQDGVAECYYFDSEGYLVTAPDGSTKTVDGSLINSDGVWINERGEAQLQNQEQQTETQNQTQQADPSDPLSIYKQALKKNASLTSYDASMSTKISMNMVGTGVSFAFDMSNKYDIQIQDMNTANVKLLLRSEASMFGETSVTTAFYKDGYAYMDDHEGSKWKVSASPDDFSEISTDGSSIDAKDFSNLTNLQMRQEGEDTILTFTMDSKTADEYLDDALSGTTYASDDTSYQLKEARGEVRINRDGYCTSEYIYISMDMTDSSGTLSSTLETSTVYRNPGQPVTINFPSTEGYREF